MENIDYFLAKYVVNRLSDDDLVNYADSCLNSGEYSDTLLAIIDNNSLSPFNDIEKNFLKAIAEQGYEIPSYKEAIYFLIKYNLKKIEAGEVDPLNQFSVLLKDVDDFNFNEFVKEYAGDSIGISMLYGLYYAVDDLHVGYCDVQKETEQIKAEMRKESKKWLDTYYQGRDVFECLRD